MIVNYATLQAAVASALHRATDTLLLAQMPRFIQLAELDIFRELPLRQIETSASGTTVGATIAIPAGTASIERLSVVTNGRDYSLDYTSPNGIDALATASLPTRYTVENGAIRLLSPPAGNYAYTLYLIPDLTPLSVATPTNWLISNAPDVYYYAVKSQAESWSQDPQSAAESMGMSERAVASIRRKDERRRFPVSGGLQIKPRGFR